MDEGDRVAVHSTLTCGRCRTCRAGLRGCTAPEFADTTIYGFRSPDVAPALWGGFSTHLYLAPEAIVVPMSPDISVAAASLFNVMSNGVDWVLDVGGFRAGQSIAILGPGPRGLASVIAANAAGAEEIAVTGLPADRARLDLALEMGADHALDVTGGSAVDAVLGAMAAPPDLVIDCTPMHLGSVTDAVHIAGRKGTVVLAGMKGPTGMAEIPVDTVSAKQLTLKGAVSRSLASMEYAITLVESGRWPFEKFASHAYSVPTPRPASGPSSAMTSPSTCASSRRSEMTPTGPPWRRRHRDRQLSDVALLAEGLSFPEGPVAMADGSVVVTEIDAARITRVGADGVDRGRGRVPGWSQWGGRRPRRGPLRVQQRGSLRRRQLPRRVGGPGRSARCQSTRLYTEFQGRPLSGPNDLVFDEAGGFWFTDLGKTRGRQRDLGSIFYAGIDGASLVEVVHPAEMPNGIGLSPGRGDRLLGRDRHGPTAGPPGHRPGDGGPA